MSDKLKIKISTDAYNTLLGLLKFHSEYNCVNLSLSHSSCCKSSKIDMVLDTTDNKYSVDNIDGLLITYSEDVKLLFKEIVIVSSGGNLYAKTVDNPLILFTSKSNCNKS